MKFCDFLHVCNPLIESRLYYHRLSWNFNVIVTGPKKAIIVIIIIGDNFIDQQRWKRIHWVCPSQIA